jgi:diadenosine tetraphosphate (Ap4A) HIT family hydrolase
MRRLRKKAVGAVLFETGNFSVVVPGRPHVSRAEGGHIVIRSKRAVHDRTELSAAAAIELMKLTMVVGEAMVVALRRRGIDIGRVNHQENGNWADQGLGDPMLHVHLYGRARSASIQPYGQALHLPDPTSGFYDGVEPLNADDVNAIRSEVTKLLGAEKYRDFCCHVTACDK